MLYLLQVLHLHRLHPHCFDTVVEVKYERSKPHQVSRNDMIPIGRACWKPP
jgi:hypothetical protein